MNRPLDGLLLVDKPPGPTSHDIVDCVRRALGQRRVGHAGTLDPLASGLLPLLVGRATRLTRFLPDGPKDYEGTLRLGLITATDDVTGEVLEHFAGRLPPTATVQGAARRLEGQQSQVPPAISARRIGGQRLYRLNRRGVQVRAAAVPVQVWQFELEPTDRPEVYRFRSRVSAGTYVRSLARDLGAALGCGGALETLRRTAIGPLQPSTRLRLRPDESPERCVLERELIPLERMPLILRSYRLDEPADAERFRHGTPICGVEPSGLLSVLSPEGRLLGVAESADGVLRPKVVLPEAD
jgi:tRNA pseudouridine55 synthase